MSKTCFKCNQTKPIDDFYKHSRMSDGHLGKCKECTKKDSRDRYCSDDGRKKIIAYELKRARDVDRRKRRVEYARRMNKRSPEKYKARNMVKNYLRDGKLFKKPCEMCGEIKVQAHHTDYSKPIDVMWLCRKHHLMIEGKLPF